jgi:hypothetical protein
MTMNQPIEKTTIPFSTKLTIHSGAVPRCGITAVLLVCFGFLPNSQAVNPPPGGGYQGGNTAEGQNALLSLTSGTFNTAVGFSSLTNDVAGQFNTAVGAAALLSNTGDPTSGDGIENTATGAGALLSNTTGFNNTANGAFALFHNINGSSNTAIGESALFENIHGNGNTAVGEKALWHNDMTGNGPGDFNTAVGTAALAFNTDGNSNTAVGALALGSNVLGLFNVAFGADASERNTDGAANVAIGDSALTSNVHGSFNTAIGAAAGADVEGDDNIYIGVNDADGVTSESATIRIGNPQSLSACFIAGIVGQTTASGVPVFIDGNGKLGTSTSSARFKDNIKPMDNASESIFSLKPVTFRYKKELDPEGIPQFGLVAEAVEKVNPSLVVYDNEGKPYSVRYDQVNAMLLNEFLKEHDAFLKQDVIVQEQGATIAELKNEIATLNIILRDQAAQVQRVSAQLQMSKPAPKTVLNNQ